MSAGRLYLDNAATSFPKPRCVHEAMWRYGVEVGATPGRAQYAESLEGGRIIRRCRERICRLVNAPSADHVVFTLNTTDALNLAIKGLVAYRQRTESGRAVHLITSAMDHNSVLRPFNALAQRAGVTWTCVGTDDLGRVDADEIARAMTADTLLVALLHASNVTGTVQPIAEVGGVCRARGVAFVLDAAQSLGHISVDMEAAQVDLLAFPGHKGMLGPLGTGGLVMLPGWERVLDPVREGGTGTASEIDVQPEFLPDKYEPGSHNAIGIAGLDAAAGWLLAGPHGEGYGHERALIRRMVHGLAERGCAMEGRVGTGDLSDYQLLGPGERAEREAWEGGRAARVGVFSLVHRTRGPRELARELEARFGILARPGVHCAPRAHGVMGTLTAEDPSRRGALRLSLGPFITETDVDRTLDALAAVGGAASARSENVGEIGTVGVR